MGIADDIVNALRRMVGTALSQEALAEKLDKLAATKPGRLDWRHSIVDLMKLVGMDSSVAARDKLATEMGYTGPLDGSAAMNIWMHERLLRRLRDEG